MPTLQELMAAGAVPVNVAAPIAPLGQQAAPGGGMSLAQLQAMGATPTTAEEPGRLEALGRGALQGVTLGFSDEIAGAIGSLFSDKSYTDIRDEARAANEAAKAAHGGFYLGGEIGGGAVGSLIPGLGVAKGASVAAAAGKAALLGGASGLGSSNADLTKGDFASAALDAAKGAAAGAVIGGGVQKLSNVLSKAPEKVKEDLLNAVTRGDGLHGSATPTAQKLLVRNKENVLRSLEESFVPEGASKPITLADIVGKPAKQVLPVVEERLQQVGSQLDPHYAVVDKATGGVSLINLVNFLDDEAAKLAKKPLNENYVNAINDIKESALRAWAPELGDKLKASSKLQSMGLKGFNIEDVKVPTKDLREMVTRLQTRGSQVINPLNPGEASIMKQDMGNMMKEFIDAHLDIASDAAPEVQNAVKAIRDINKTYNGLKTVEKALLQRGEKEATGGTSLAGHGFNLLGHGGMLGAGMMAAHGNIPGAVAAVALPKVIQKAPAIARAGTKLAAGADAMLSSLRNAAEAGNPWAQAQLRAMQGAEQTAIVNAGMQLGQ